MLHADMYQCLSIRNMSQTSKQAQFLKHKTRTKCVVKDEQEDEVLCTCNCQQLWSPPAWSFSLHIQVPIALFL